MLVKIIINDIRLIILLLQAKKTFVRKKQTKQHRVYTNKLTVRIHDYVHPLVVMGAG